MSLTSGWAAPAAHPGASHDKEDPMDKRWRRGLAGALLLVVLYAGAAMWPTALGGATTYVSTHGSSMEPTFHQGDLALVRQANHYDVGDVVAYRSATLHTTVLHRIVAHGPQGYTFKGDNNSFEDPDHPNESDLIGKLWVHVPKGGKLLGALRVVLPLVLVGLSLLGAGAATTRNRSRKKPAHLAARSGAPSSVRNWRSATIGLAVTASLCLALGYLSFGRPTSQSGSEPVRYTQQGTFTYSATAPSGPVYADGTIRTGDPVFRRLVKQLDVTFAYALASTATRQLAGTIAVRTEVRSGNGWHRVLDSLPAQAFTGDGSSATVHLDLDKLESMVQVVEYLTGVKGGDTVVSIRPEAKIVGVLGSQQLEQTYAPTLDFRLEPLQLKLSDPGAQLETTVGGTLQHTMDVPRQMEAFGLALPVGTARTLSLLLGVPALLGAGAGLVAMRRRLQDEADHIELRHGHRIVPVTAIETTNEIDVTSMLDLARLAEQHGSLILRRQGTLSKDYLLRADGVVYRYRAGDGGRGRIEPPIASAARYADVPTPPPAPPIPKAAPVPPVEAEAPAPPLVPAEPLIDGTYRFRSGDGYVAD
ncbi:MAG: peptidase signal peptidase [Actinomycetia bacterium]|nr:peptidase signal peptidase [Actinomycetes bacterium]